jgi:hypothetical protein
MSKHFRPLKIDQTQLLPPSIGDFVPEDHLVAVRRCGDQFVWSFLVVLEVGGN